MKLQKIKYTNSGRAYVAHYGTKIYLDEVLRDYINPNIGYKHISNIGGYKITISDDAETAVVQIVIH